MFIGENLAVANYFDEQGSFKQVVQQEVDSWYAEGNTCDFSNPSSCGGHFTQMVWSATTEVSIILIPSILTI